jgi:hypothetical protein
LRSLGFRCGGFRSVFGFDSAVAVAAEAAPADVAVPVVFLRPRPPRVPRRRLAGEVVDAPASGGAEGCGLAAPSGAAAGGGACSGRVVLFRRNSFSKECLLCESARRRIPERGAGRAALSEKGETGGHSHSQRSNRT